MFVESLVESTPLLRTQSRMPALISLAVQCLAVAALLAIPLLHPEVLHTGPIHLSTLAPHPTPTPPPPVQRVHVTAHVATNASAAPSAPSQIPNQIRNLLQTTGAAIDDPVIAISTNMGPSNPALPAGINSATPTVVARPSTEHASPIRVSSGVTAGLLAAPIQPIYPQMACITRTEGTVVIEAIISKTGHIESAHAVSGPALLQAAALDAVRAARYHPYLLNGDPCEVETTISINFRMN